MVSRGHKRTSGGGGGGVTWVIFRWMCAAGILEPLPHFSLFVVYFVANIDPVLVTFAHCSDHCSLFLVYFADSYRTHLSQFL